MMEVRFTQLYNKSLQFLNIDIPHGSVATRMRRGEIFALPDDTAITLSVKEF